MDNTQNAYPVPDGFARVKGSERHPYKNAEFLGPSDPNEEFTVTILLRRRADGPPLPGYEKIRRHGTRISPVVDDFAGKFGAHPDEMKQVINFALNAGLHIVEAHNGKRAVKVSGTAGQMSRAFGVNLGVYSHLNETDKRKGPTVETHRGRDGFVHVPTALQDIVTGVFGLDNRNVTKKNAADPPNTKPITVYEVTQLYNYPTNLATGQTIGIVSTDGFWQSDIQNTFGVYAPNIIQVSVDGAVNSNQPDLETTQDISISAMSAPGATIAVYFQHGGQQGWVDLFHKVAYPTGTDPKCSVVSSSFYICNGDDPATLANEGITAAFVNAVNDAFYDAAMQGVTICIASGDTGTNSKVGDGKAHVQFPGSSPWVLAVGGTTIGNVNGSAYDEYVWNDPAPTDPAQWGTTGGGVSAFFPLPSYQSGANVPVNLNDGQPGRGVPDIAGNASLNSGYMGIYVGGYPQIGNGTSASSPQWAGLIAVINAALGQNIGFANPAFYELGPTRVFNDIVPGNGPANNGNSGVPGYPAGPGWDACTGWGSPNGVNILNGLRSLIAANAGQQAVQR